MRPERATGSSVAARRRRTRAEAQYLAAVVKDALREARGRHAERWLQVNCALFPQGPGCPPYVPWAELAQTLAVWRSEGRFRLTFFMQKPPGLRLRFCGRRLERRLELELIALLETLERRDLIRGFRFGIYEPEVYHFGGAVGMELAHEQFDHDSRLAMAYAALPDAQRGTLTPSRFSIAATGDLLARCVEDRVEAWDIWQRLARVLGGVRPRSEVGPDTEALRDAMLLSPAFHQSLSPQTAHLIEEVQAANALTAARLHASLAAGGLRIGARQWLTSVCIFHWNRLGLTTAELVPMAAEMGFLLSPYGGATP